MTLSANVNYLRPGLAGEALTASTREIKAGRQTAVYEVEVRQQERILATAVFTMYYVDYPMEKLK